MRMDSSVVIFSTAAVAGGVEAQEAHGWMVGRSRSRSTEEISSSSGGSLDSASAAVLSSPLM